MPCPHVQRSRLATPDRWFTGEYMATSISHIIGSVDSRQWFLNSMVHTLCTSVSNVFVSVYIVLTAWAKFRVINFPIHYVFMSFWHSSNVMSSMFFGPCGSGIVVLIAICQCAYCCLKPVHGKIVCGSIWFVLVLVKALTYLLISKLAINVSVQIVFSMIIFLFQLFLALIP